MAALLFAKKASEDLLLEYIKECFLFPNLGFLLKQ